MARSREQGRGVTSLGGGGQARAQGAGRRSILGTRGASERGGGVWSIGAAPGATHRVQVVKVVVVVKHLLGSAADVHHCGWKGGGGWPGGGRGDSQARRAAGSDPAPAPCLLLDRRPAARAAALLPQLELPSRPRGALHHGRPPHPAHPPVCTVSSA